MKERFVVGDGWKSPEFVPCRRIICRALKGGLGGATIRVEQGLRDSS